MAWLKIAKGAFDFLKNNKESGYTPIALQNSNPSDTSGPKIGLGPFSDQGYMGAFDKVTSSDGAGADDSAAKDEEKKEEKKGKGYGDTAAWVGAAVNLLSSMEKERQQKQANLMAQQNASANYGLNAMGYAGNALDRLNRGRMGSYGLSSMAGH